MCCVPQLRHFHLTVAEVFSIQPGSDRPPTRQSPGSTRSAVSPSASTSQSVPAGWQIPSLAVFKEFGWRTENYYRPSMECGEEDVTRIK